MFLILFVLSVATLFYVYVKWSYTYWKRNNVPGPEPTLFFGNIKPILTLSENWSVVLADWYKKYANEPFIGFYKLMRSGLVIRDVDLVKDILSKDFDKFEANDTVISKKWDKLFATNPFFVVGDEWRESRKTILPAFSSTKLKNIFPIMNGVGDELVKYIKSFKSGTEFNAKDLLLRFTIQNVVRSAFSIDAKCFDKNQESEFVKINRDLFQPSFFVSIKFMLVFFLPPWAINFLPIPFVPPKIDAFFRNMVKANRESRFNEKKTTDILQMLIQTQEKHSIKTDIFVAGHAFSLFGDGTETSSQALSFTFYDLAANPDIQQKLYEDIVSKLDSNDGKWSAEALQNMTYLEGILHESMRIHPPFAVLAKRCTKPYELPKNDHQSEAMTIQPGTVINIPVLGIHMDPKYYPNPDEYNPERFLPEEQRNRHKGTYLSFGEGARICPGMRFAIAQMKVAVAYVVKNFRIKLSPNHKPIVIDPQAVLTYPKDGILLELEPR